MIEFIKKWRERRRRKLILEDIKMAKAFFDGGEKFMCNCFFRVDTEKYTNACAIKEIIPEFNRETLGAISSYELCAWWDYNDKESRIKAFEKLIEIYSDYSVGVTKTTNKTRKANWIA